MKNVLICMGWISSNREYKYINGTRGVISIMLALLMVPFVTIAGALINAGRINSAVAIFDEALCNASNSTLGTYDEFLKERFGLLAISQNSELIGFEYTPQDFIDETFKYYMEKNMEVLSNTYVSSDISAEGVYPLADKTVMLSEIMSYGQYIVPTKMIVDGLSIEDLINTYTKKLGFITNVLNTLTSSVGIATSIDDYNNAVEDAKNKISNCCTALTEYEKAHTDFQTAVETYNSLIDEMQSELNRIQSNINNAISRIDSSERKIEEERNKHNDLISQIEELENDVDSEGNPIDHSEEIEEIKKSNAKALEAYDQAVKEKEQAESDKESYEQEYTRTEESYKNRINNQRETVRGLKSTYIGKIDSLAVEINKTGEAIINMQDKAAKMINSGVECAGNLVLSVSSYKSQTYDDDIEKAKENLQNAINADAPKEEINALQKALDDLEDSKTKFDNDGDLTKASKTAIKENVSTLEEFDSRDYTTAFSIIYSGLVDLKNNVNNNYTIIETQDKMAIPSLENGYYLSVIIPITCDEIDNICQDLASSAIESGIIAFFKAAISFIKALITISIRYDWTLDETINTAYYSGKLPSQRDRTLEQYSLKSEHDSEDYVKSQEYKAILGEYSTNSDTVQVSSRAENFVEQLISLIDELQGCFENVNFLNFLKKICQALGVCGRIIVLLFENVDSFFITALNGLNAKLLTIGYIGYNTANRTTYGDKALTGANFDLPGASNQNPGIAFKGAETEYIINGSMSEKENQIAVFNIIYVIRAVLDLFTIIPNPEVEAIASSAAAVLCGVGGVIVYVLYFTLEPLVDSIILVNGGTIPYLKTFVFLTPTGIPRLVDNVLQLGLKQEHSRAIKDNTKELVSNFASDESKKQQLTNKLNEIDDATKNDGSRKFQDSFSFDYTKMLILVMLFWDIDELISHLIDVIQMEATYKAKSGIIKYDFDIDQSYTYIRASGSFVSNEFIRLSDASGLTSTERIIYRGY